MRLVYQARHYDVLYNALHMRDQNIIYQYHHLYHICYHHYIYTFMPAALINNTHTTFNNISSYGISQQASARHYYTYIYLLLCARVIYIIDLC